jgi:hypothetical protein
MSNDATADNVREEYLCSHGRGRSWRRANRRSYEQKFLDQKATRL